MKALILNSGIGSRMGDITKSHPKCMTEITGGDTILSRQLRLLEANGITDVVITTGYFDEVLIEYCESLDVSMNISYVKNPLFDKTNYIYSIYCAREILDDDIVLMHGDLVFENVVLKEILSQSESCMKVSSTLEIPEKDFKAVVRDGRVYAVGVEFFEEVMEAQALYLLYRKEWEQWLGKITEFCESGKTGCYAEVAFNEISRECCIKAYDVKDYLCTEIDNADDLRKVCSKLRELEGE